MALFRNWPGNLEQTLGKIKAKPEVSRAATADKAAAGDPSVPPDLKSSRAATVPTPNGRQEAKGVKFQNNLKIWYKWNLPFKKFSMLVFLAIFEQSQGWSC